MSTPRDYKLELVQVVGIIHPLNYPANSYFRYKCEKVILSSCGRLRPSEARVKRPHEDKITFSLEYRTQFFDTTCGKLNLGHAFLLERVRNRALRTECERSNFLLKPTLQLFRHGARTYALGEGSLVRPQDLDESIIATYGYFELTNIGKTQLYEFGRALRERYGGFLGDVYRPHELYARTTDTSRTKMSLMLLLAGLFPPTTKQAWNTELKWTPIPFDYLPTELDLLLKPFEKARYKQQLEEVLKFPELQEKTNQLFESTKFLGDMGISGIKREGYHGAMGILNVISCHKSANASLPEWYTEDLYASFKEYAKLNLDIMVWNTELKKYAIGPLIKTFLQNMNIDNKVSNPRKIYLYSAHEMNVAAFTRAHKIESYRYPEYGSAVILEKFRDATGQLFVRMVYWTGVGGKYKVLKLRGHEYCPINEYINLVKSVTPTDEEINSMYKELKVDANRFHTTDFVFQSNNGL